MKFFRNILIATAVLVPASALYATVAHAAVSLGGNAYFAKDTGGQCSVDKSSTSAVVRCAGTGYAAMNYRVPASTTSCRAQGEFAGNGIIPHRGRVYHGRAMTWFHITVSNRSGWGRASLHSIRCRTGVFLNGDVVSATSTPGTPVGHFRVLWGNDPTTGHQFIIGIYRASCEYPHAMVTRAWIGSTDWANVRECGVIRKIAIS